MEDPTTNILGVSQAVCELRSYLPKVALRDAPVLITGETGTGKELVAESIHRLSPRCGAPFVAVNCAALPEALIESELFGHERGAFTGALTEYRGKAAEADGGTLFLDEIGEMPPFGQAKLLRFLESGHVDRVGSTKSIHVNTRIVAATNRPVEDLMSERRFREDLYYRLNVARIEIDPLRERTEDIPVLVGRFVDHFNQKYDLDVGPPDQRLLDRFAKYQWPGNIRELRNMIEAIFIDPPSGTIDIDHLPPVFRVMLRGHRRTILDERDQLIDTLSKTNWNKTEAAKKLNVSRMTLYRKIAKYHLDSSSDDFD